jgi:hypothetical protein
MKKSYFAQNPFTKDFYGRVSVGRKYKYLSIVWRCTIPFCVCVLNASANNQGCQILEQNTKTEKIYQITITKWTQNIPNGRK